jgi:hypothetical protein
MVTQRRSVAEVRCIRGFIVTFLAITAAILLIAQPVAVNAAEQEIPVKEIDGKLITVKVKYDDWIRNISATVDGKPLMVYGQQPYPVKLGENTRLIVGIYGPVIVFEGNSKCLLVGGRWIGYPPGTVCP